MEYKNELAKGFHRRAEAMRQKAEHAANDQARQSCLNVAEYWENKAAAIEANPGLAQPSHQQKSWSRSR